MNYIDYKHKIEFGKNEYDIINNYCDQKNRLVGKCMGL